MPLFRHLVSLSFVQRTRAILPYDRPVQPPFRHRASDVHVLQRESVRWGTRCSLRCIFPDCSSATCWYHHTLSLTGLPGSDEASALRAGVQAVRVRHSPRAGAPTELTGD